jgi:hypothetical protein
MTVFIMEYRRIGYTLADGMHPNPNRGKRRFTVDSKDVGTDDISVLAVAAKAPENTPEGYELFSVRDRDAGTEIKP